MGINSMGWESHFSLTEQCRLSGAWEANRRAEVNATLDSRFKPSSLQALLARTWEENWEEPPRELENFVSCVLRLRTSCWVRFQIIVTNVRRTGPSHELWFLLSDNLTKVQINDKLSTAEIYPDNSIQLYRTGRVIMAPSKLTHQKFLVSMSDTLGGYIVR